MYKYLMKIWLTCIKVEQLKLEQEFEELVLDFTNRCVLRIYRPVELADKVYTKLSKIPTCKHSLENCCVCKFGMKKNWNVSYVLYYAGAIK